MMTAKSQTLFSSYLLVSLLVSLGIGMEAWFYTAPKNSEQLFFAATLILGTAYLYRHLALYGLFSDRVKAVSGVFLFQAFCLIGMSLTQKSLGPIYLCFVPVFGATSYFLSRLQDRPAMRLRRIQWLYGLSLLMVGGLHFLVQSDVVISGRGPWSLLWFFTWSLGTIMLAHRNVFRPKHKKERVLTDENQDQLFAHDLINHSMGLKLFLASKQTLSVDDCLMLQTEVETLQTLVMDHYGFQHKDLDALKEWRSLGQLKAPFYGLVQSFLSSSGHCALTIDFDLATSDQVDYSVHFPSFYRIFSNLVKNARDHGAPAVAIELRVEGPMLYLQVKSKLKSNLQSSPALERDLSALILMEDEISPMKSREKLGLESVTRLCEAVGGEFSFSLEAGHWVNTVKLPLKAEGSSQKLAA